MQINFYKNNSDAKTINKNLQLLGSTNAVFKDETSILHPSLLLTGIDGIVGEINYLQIPELGRYYFVREIQAVRTGLFRIECDVDALESWKQGILNLTGIVERQQYKYNLMQEDEMFKVYQDKIVEEYKAPNGFNNTGQFILIVAGGETV